MGIKDFHALGEAFPATGLANTEIMGAGQQSLE